MEIISMRNVDWNNKVKAILTIKTSEGFEMKNFKLVDGVNGMFVSSPSLKDSKVEGKYHDTIWIPKELRDDLNDKASKTYDPQLEAGKVYPEFEKKTELTEEDIPF